jgi:hypothetical protein
MSNFSLGEAVLGTGVDLSGLRSGMNKAHGESKGLWSRVTDVAQNALGFMTGDLLMRGVDAVVGLGRELGDTLLNEAPAFQQLETSFENLAASAGQNSQEILASMRAASDGMINDADLMTSYNEAMLLVGDSMADKFPALLEIARASAAATGEDVGFLLDSLVKGIGRGSPMILDNLGLTINLAEANQAYADSLGIAVDEMTKAQQQEALLNAVVEAGSGFVERLGDNTGGAAATIAQLKTTFQNLKMSLASSLLPALQAILEPLAALAMEYGPKVAEWLEGVVPILENFVKTIVTAPDEGGVLLDYLQELPGFLQPVATAMAEATIFLSELMRYARVFFDLVGAGIDPLTALRSVLINALGQETGEKISSAIGEMVSFVQSIVGQLVTWFQANLPLIIQTGQTLATFWQTHLVPALDNAWAIIKTLVSTAITLITNVITLAMQVINGDWNGAWETIKTTASTVWEAIKTIITQFIEGVLNTIGSNLDQFIATWRSNWNMAKTIATTLLARIRAAISNFNLAEAGKALIQGLIGGIKAKAGEVVDAARGVVKNAIDAAKRLLGIASPSTVFWNFGENAGSSLAGGMAAEASIVEASAGTLVNRAIGGAGAAMTGAGATGGGPLEIHVHIEHAEIHDNRDIRELARQIAEELGAELRQRSLGPAWGMA